MKTILTLLFALCILFLFSDKLFSQDINKSKNSFQIKTYDGKTLPAQILMGDQEKKSILFIHGSTPYDEKGNIGGSWTDQGRIIAQKHEFYTRFLHVMNNKGYSVATLAKRSFIYPTEIPRPNTSDLSLDIFFFISELINRGFIENEKDLVLVGYSEGSMVATKVLGLLKTSPQACILLGSGSMPINFNNLSIENFYQTDHLRKIKKWTDEQIRTEINQLASINDSLRNMNEKEFEQNFKNSKPYGFGFAPWESFYIDKEWPLYNSVPNIIYANVPLLMCIAENDAAMPLNIARNNFDELVRHGFNKGTFRIIENEVHQYKKYDVYGIIDHWLSSDYQSTNFELTATDSLSIAEYRQSKLLIDQINALSYQGGQLNESRSIFQNALESEYMDEDTWFQFGIKLVANKLYEEAYEAFSRSTESTFIACFASLTWMGHLQDLQNNRQEAIRLYQKALEQYPGFPVQHDHWNIHIDRSWIEKRMVEPFSLNNLEQ